MAGSSSLKTSKARRRDAHAGLAPPASLRSRAPMSGTWFTAQFWRMRLYDKTCNIVKPEKWAVSRAHELSGLGSTRVVRFHALRRSRDHEPDSVATGVGRRRPSGRTRLREELQRPTRARWKRFRPTQIGSGKNNISRNNRLAAMRPRRRNARHPPCRVIAPSPDFFARQFCTPHSITSSARARRVGGTARPSALAVGRLTTSSNLVDRTTGRSAGLAPLSMLPV